MLLFITKFPQNSTNSKPNSFEQMHQITKNQALTHTPKIEKKLASTLILHLNSIKKETPLLKGLTLINHDLYIRKMNNNLITT